MTPPHWSCCCSVDEPEVCPDFAINGNCTVPSLLVYQNFQYDADSFSCRIEGSHVITGLFASSPSTWFTAAFPPFPNVTTTCGQSISQISATVGCRENAASGDTDWFIELGVTIPGGIYHIVWSQAVATSGDTDCPASSGYVWESTTFQTGSGPDDWTITQPGDVFLVY